MFWTSLAVLYLFITTPSKGQPSPPLNRRARKGRPGVGFWRGLLGEPRSVVFLVLLASLVIGGGSRLRKAMRGRDARSRLDDPEILPKEIEAVAEFGRAGMLDLFRILETGKTREQRLAAGKALSVLWAGDEMIPEEEKAIVIRGHEVTWKGRRRYPRAMKSAIPFGVVVEVPFLTPEGKGVSPEHLEWSFRVTGSRRADLEAFGPWTKGSGRMEFTVIPDDFETNGPHQLAIQTRVRTTGLTDTWEINLPHSRFMFEFDPLLKVDALLASMDDSRGEMIQNGIRLVHVERPEGVGENSKISLGNDFAILNAPVLEIVQPLPCDLSHKLELEFEGIEGRFPAGDVIVTTLAAGDESRSATVIPITSAIDISAEQIGRPGSRKVRAWLTPDSDLGWTNPDVRSIWPGVVVTGWVGVEVLRR